MAENTTEEINAYINKYFDTKEKKYVAVGFVGFVAGALVFK